MSSVLLDDSPPHPPGTNRQHQNLALACSRATVLANVRKPPKARIHEDRWGKASRASAMRLKRTSAPQPGKRFGGNGHLQWLTARGADCRGNAGNVPRQEREALGLSQL